MGLSDVAPWFLFAAEILIIFVAVVFLISGLDDFLVDLVHIFRTWYRRLFVLPRHEPLTEDQLQAKPEQPIALMIPAWEESPVIRRMLEHTLRSVDYSNYVIFVGTYPNDPATQREVELARESFRAIERIVCPADGPTTKADCLNWIYQGIKNYEAEHGTHFEIFVVSDAEDAHHPLTLKLFNYLVPRKDMVQLPVIPFEGKWYEFTRGHYLDEFAENHSKDLLVRERLAGTLPSAGVGCAFSRRCFRMMAARQQNVLFDTRSLTEDYDFGLRLREFHLKQIFVKQVLTRFMVKTTRRGIQKEKRKEIIAIREYFPDTFQTAVRQKARWTIGIGLQGWKSLGWKGSLQHKHMLFRDRKAIITNQVNFIGYFVLALVVTMWLGRHYFPESYHYPPLVRQGTLLWNIILVDTFFLAWRLFQRGYYVYRIFGWQQSFLSVPRAAWANFINFMACNRALFIYFKAQAKGGQLTWDKTAHVFPSESQLQGYRRLLGDLLLERRMITVRRLEAALEKQKELGFPLGRMLVEEGLVDESELLQVLSFQLNWPIEKITIQEIPPGVLQAIPLEVAKEFSLVAVGQTGNRLIVATCDYLSPREIDLVEKRLGKRLSMCLATRAEIAFAIRYACEPIVFSQAFRDFEGALKEIQADSDRYNEVRQTPGISYSRLGDILLQEGQLTARELKEALREYDFEEDQPLGEYLIEKGILTPAQLRQSLYLQKERFRPLSDLVDAARMKVEAGPDPYGD